MIDGCLHTGNVSILVVLDDWFGHATPFDSLQNAVLVSILVVLDDWFGQLRRWFAADRWGKFQSLLFWMIGSGATTGVADRSR